MLGDRVGLRRIFMLGNAVFGLGALELLILGTLMAVLLSMLGQYWTGAIGLGYLSP